MNIKDVVSKTRNINQYNYLRFYNIAHQYLSLNKQIIAISHLPQICAMADRNIKVEKFTSDNLTKTKSTSLLGEDLYFEIARLRGVNQNEQGIQVSVDLKEKSNKYKKEIN